MMKVTSVRIEDFKSFADTGEVKLGQVNVLVGRNNHGKSAFIRAVHLMQQGSQVADDDIRIGRDVAVVRISVVTDKLSNFQRYYSMNSDELALLFNLQRGGSLSITATIPERRPQRVISIGQLLQQEPHNFIYTYLSKRKVAAFDQVVDLNKARSVISDMRYLVAKVDRLANPGYPHHKEYAELCDAILGFLITAYPSPNGKQAGILIGSHDSIPLESMGEGVSSQLGLITDLCMADGNLFLIEEPENDIHPEALKTLLGVIVEKSKTNQFIVSTHSNIVTRYLGAAPDSKVFEFDSTYRRGEVPTSAIRAVEPTPEARIQVLRRLGYELTDFDLWDGWLILEESSAEIIIRYVVPWFVPNLARVRTVAAGGTSKVEPTFEDFRRLFLFAHLEVQYHGRAWVVVDGDTEGKKVAAALRDKYKSWPADHFTTWSQPEFEHYYPARFADQINEALGKSHDDKRAVKKALLDDVKAWCNANPEEAKAAFETSATEVIEKLREIDNALRAAN